MNLDYSFFISFFAHFVPDRPDIRILRKTETDYVVLRHQPKDPIGFQNHIGILRKAQNDIWRFAHIKNFKAILGHYRGSFLRLY